MRGRILLAVLLTLLLGGAAPAEEYHGEYYSEPGSVYGYYHRTERCALAARRAAPDGDDTVKGNGIPCPACVPDAARYPGIEACERGGTVVVRVPDDVVVDALNWESSPAEVPTALLYEAETRDDDLVRLFHGDEYLALLDLESGGNAEVVACIPDIELNEGDLMMSRRHLGGAWYFVLRPGKAVRQALAEGKKLALALRYYRVPLAVRCREAGFTFDAGEAECRDMRVAVKPKKSVNQVILEWKRSFDGDSDVTVYRDRDVNTCVLRVPEDDRRDFHRWLKYGGMVTELRGYRSGGTGVYCVVVTDGEVAALREKLAFDEDYEPVAWGVPAETGEDWAPVTRSRLWNGTLAEMAQAEYPVGTPFVSYRLTRPEGGIATYEVDGALERRTAEGWTREANITPLTCGDPERDFTSNFCDWVDLVVPLNHALEPGLYRLRIAGDDWNATLADWLEFRVRDGAPAPVMPEPRVIDEVVDIPAHTPVWAEPGYNSCLDNTAHRGKLLVEGTVFELKGSDLSWGWGIESHYNLYCYPEGHPEQARLLRENIDGHNLELWDAGDGLLLWGTYSSYDVCRCGYDGSDFRKIARLEGEEGSVGRPLFAGDDIYYDDDAGGIWRMPLDTGVSEMVYRHGKGEKDAFYDSTLQVVDGTLLAANDYGIFAFDTAARDADGFMPATRLTQAYDPDDHEAGMGYLVLGGRLYCWSKADKAMVSMNLDGGDRQVVSKTHYFFSQASREGIVLALYGHSESEGKPSENLFGGNSYDGVAFCFPPDPERPTFDPDHSEKRAVSEKDYDYLFGDHVVHLANYDNDDEETVETFIPLSALKPD